jgi:hypothetical protein
MGNEGDYRELPNGDHYRGKHIRIYVVSNRSQQTQNGNFALGYLERFLGICPCSFFTEYTKELGPLSIPSLFVLS